MNTPQEFRTWPGHDAVAPDGKRIGMVDRVFTDRETGIPSFAEILTGALNDVPKLVPLDGAWLHDDHVHVAHGAEVVVAAPDVDAGDELDPETERQIREHYVIVVEGTEQDDDTVIVERELPLREPLGHETVERETITAPVVEPT